MAGIHIQLPVSTTLGEWRKALNRLIKEHGPDIVMANRGEYGFYLEVPVDRNGRYYPVGVLKKALKEYKKFGGIKHG
jgi:hypothetical protein